MASLVFREFHSVELDLFQLATRLAAKILIAAQKENEGTYLYLYHWTPTSSHFQHPIEYVDLYTEVVVSNLLQKVVYSDICTSSPYSGTARLWIFNFTLLIQIS